MSSKTQRFRGTPVPICFGLLAVFTLSASARAETAQLDDVAASKSPDGPTVRMGSSVGFSEIAGESWATLGGHVAVGYRLGPFALEAEYERNKLLYYTGLTNRLRGHLKRAGISGRLYLAEMGSGKSRWNFFAEGGVGSQRGNLEELQIQREDYGVGAGWLLDVRRSGDSGIKRVGWHFGWRFMATPSAGEAAARVVCQKKCPEIMPTTDRYDLGMAVSSSLQLSW